MNEELYEKIEIELLKHRMEDEVEDILLEMAEILAEMNILDKEIICRKKISQLKLEVCGICEKEVENSDEINVYIKTLTINGKMFQIEDYLL